jgi:23S rRNA (uracil1939-C5)-methyltransferase
MGDMRTEIYSLAFGGDGIGKVDGKVVFVRGAVPGDEVVFSPVKATDSYIKGELKELVVPSSDRETPACPFYGVCGGCQLQHLKYEKETEYKKEQVLELLKRVGRLGGFETGPIVPSCGPYGYRSSVTLHRGANGFGYFLRDSDDIVAITECPVAEKAISGLLREKKDFPFTDEVTLKADVKGKVWISDRAGDRFFEDTYMGFDMFFSPKAFSQCNRYIAGRIVSAIGERLGPPEKGDVFFDMYSGTGFFSFLSGKGFGSVVGMESSGISIDCAKSTMKKHGLKGTKFYKGDVDREFSGLYETHMGGRNFALFDPPRKGMTKGLIQKVVKAKRLEKVLYLSCDPANLARDAKMITESGKLRLARVEFFDMFPRTTHVETLAEFVRNA